MHETALRVENLHKTYTTFSVNDVGFTIPMGSIMGFLGNNGAGKSTTLKSIMGLIRYEKGTIEILGKDTSEPGADIMNEIGYVAEEPYFYDHVTVAWYGRFASQVYRIWDEDKFNRLCRAYRLDLNKTTNELSRGMKVKLGLALALAHNPRILILDEPTSGMDPASRRQLLAQLALFTSTGDKAVLFSSHIITDIEKAADTVTIIKEGRILLSEDKNSLLERGKDPRRDQNADNSLEALFLELVGHIDTEELEVVV